MNPWPPPTQGMSVHELIQLRTIAIELLSHLKEEIPRQCGVEGHLWSEPRRDVIVVDEGVWHEPSGNVFCAPGYYEGREEKPAFSRECSRCGKFEKRAAIIEQKSPF